VRNLIVISFLILTLYSCKSSNIVPDDVTQSYVVTYIDELVKKDIINENPLIIYNDKTLGSLKTVGLDNINLKHIKKYNLIYLKKNSIFYEHLFGEKARYGVVVFSNNLILHCGKPPSAYYVMDGNSIGYDNIEKIDWNILSRFIHLDDIKDKDGNFIRLNLFNTN
jgi:hypothetical protein